MSQIATGYAVSSELLNHLAQTIKAGEYANFWKILNKQAITVEPTYRYSGNVVAIALELLASREWLIIDSLTMPSSITTLLDLDIGLVSCLSANEAMHKLATLKTFDIKDSELASYFEDFTGDAWDESVVALREAIDYIAKTLALVPNYGEWILLFIC